MNLDDAFFPALTEFARSIHTPPEYLLRALWLESRLEPGPKSHRSGSRYYGLNQLDSAFLRAHGVDPEAYLQMSASEQLRVGVLPYWREMIANYKVPTPIRSVGVLQAIQLAPAHVRDGAPSRVLYSQGESGYEGNKALDRDHDGRIVIGDLDWFFDEVMPKQGDWYLYQPVAARLAQESGSVTTVAATPSMMPTLIGFAAAGLFLGTVGYAAFAHANNNAKRAA